MSNKENKNKYIDEFNKNFKLESLLIVVVAIYFIVVKLLSDSNHLLDILMFFAMFYSGIQFVLVIPKLKFNEDIILGGAKIEILTFKTMIYKLLFSISFILIYISILIWYFDITGNIEKAGIIGSIIAAIGFGANVWAPDIYYAFILLRSESMNHGDIVYFDEKYYLVKRIGIFETILIQCINNNTVSIKNSIIADKKIDNLTQKSKEFGLIDKISLNIPIEYKYIEDKNYTDFKKKIDDIFNDSYQYIKNQELIEKSLFIILLNEIFDKENTIVEKLSKIKSVKDKDKIFRKDEVSKINTELFNDLLKYTYLDNTEKIVERLKKYTIDKNCFYNIMDEYATSIYSKSKNDLKYNLSDDESKILTDIPKLNRYNEIIQMYLNESISIDFSDYFTTTDIKEEIKNIDDFLDHVIVCNDIKEIKRLKDYIKTKYNKINNFIDKYYLTIQMYETKSSEESILSNNWLYENIIPRYIFIDEKKDIEIFIVDIYDYKIKYNIYFYNNELTNTYYTSEARRVLNSKHIFREEIIRKAFNSGVDLRVPFLNDSAENYINLQNKIDK